MRLLTVVVVLAAASAASGCVTVSPRTAGPEPASGPVAPSAVGRPGPVVQGPALEALATVRPEPAESPKRKPERRAAPRPAVNQPVRHHRQAHAPAPDRPLPRVGVPKVPGGGSVCDMGEKYGGWTGQSDASRICHQTYGN
ncbi:hypothetical protein ACFXJ5_27875 [Streptomyces sp. NPDC059373]